MWKFIFFFNRKNLICKEDTKKTFCVSFTMPLFYTAKRCVYTIILWMYVCVCDNGNFRVSSLILVSIFSILIAIFFSKRRLNVCLLALFNFFNGILIVSSKLQPIFGNFFMHKVSNSTNLQIHSHKNINKQTPLCIVHTWPMFVLNTNTSTASSDTHTQPTV